MQTEDNVSLLSSSNEIDSGEWVPLHKRKKLSIWHIFCINGCNISVACAFSMINALGTPLMNQDLKFNPVLSDTLWSLFPFIQLIMENLAGVWSDTTGYKGGRRRIVINIGGYGTLVSYILMFLTLQFTNWSMSLRRTVFVIAFVIACFAMPLLHGAARWILGDVIPENQQVLANSILNVVQGVTAMCIDLFGGFRVAKLIGIEGFDDTRLTFCFGMFWMIIGLILTQIYAKEEQFTGDSRLKNPFVEIFHFIRHIPKVVLILSIALVFSWFAYWPFQIHVTDFFGQLYKDKNLDYEDGKAFGMLVLASHNLFSALYSAIQDWICDKIGIKWAYAVSQLIHCATMAPIYWVENKWVLFALFTIMGISQSAFNTLPYAIVGMVVPLNQNGVAMGAVRIFNVIGEQLGTFVLCMGVNQAAGKGFGVPISASAIPALIAAIISVFVPAITHHKEEYAPIE